MKLTVVAVSVLIALSSAASAQTLFSQTQDPVAGSRVFGAKGCSRCHAVNGVGGGVGPDLARIQRPRTFYDLAAALWNHAPKMAQRMRQMGIVRPQLDARETGDLVAFLFTLDYFDPQGDVEAGRRLFTAKQCIQCHQVGGVGGVVGPSLDALKQFDSPIFLAATMWNHSGKMADLMRAKGIERPTFQDAELLNLVTFINSTSTAPRGGPLVVLPGRPDEGRRLFAEKRCVVCHSAGGQGGRVAPDLAERGVPKSLTQFAAAMWNKAPAMQREMKNRAIVPPELRPEEMADIVAYLYSVRYFAQGGNPRNGAALATYKGCLGCHGLHGERGKPASDLVKARSTATPAGVMAALWNHAFISDQRPERERAPWPEFRAEEMADLVAFLQSVRSPR